jgi:DNA-binding NtrC family response regulator
MNLRNTKLLFIEDDQVDQMAFKRFFDLGKTELAYQLASSYQEAIELMEKEKFDIIISDYSLNMHTGSEVIAAAGDTPVIIVTGMGDEETAIKVMHEGAYDYVVKDSEYRYLKILPLAIKKVLGRKQSEEEIKKLPIMRL